MENKQKKKEVVDKKSILPKTAVKGLINGFVAYGILLIFIFLTVTIFTAWLVENHKNVVDYDVLKISLPLMAAFIIFFLVRATCRLSTYDLFKNCKIEKEEVDDVCMKMNLFYICLVAFSVGIIIVYLITRFSNERIQISKNLMNYREANIVYAQEKETELIDNYEENRANVLIQTLIIETGLLLGIFSLIPNQRRLINIYN